MNPVGDLSGRRILVVEDDFFLASDLQQTLSEAGAEVIGPFSRAAGARDALGQGGNDVSAAVLDVNLAGAMIYPLAAELREAGIPFLFATGYDARSIPADFQSVPRLVKPIERQRLLASLLSLVRH